MKDALKVFFEKQVFSRPSTRILFNQYKDDAKDLDIRGGARIRRENLFNYLSSLNGSPRCLLVGEAPGPWGCRFSGVPFTGERPLSRGELPFAGKATSVSEEPYSERAGTVFWETLRGYHSDFFVWNTIPFHPHREQEPLSIRTPKWTEVKAHLPLLEELLTILKPQKVAAIGRVAEKALTTVGCECIYVRHPSYGGVKLFKSGMSQFFNNRK
jgi:uracil-DNA glycosylase